MKTCTKCGEEKPLDQFYRHKRRPDGRDSKCATCTRAATAAWVAQNRERSLAYLREYHAEHRKEASAQKRRRRIEAPHVHWAGEYAKRSRAYGFTPVIERFTRDDLFARYGDACVHCGGPFEELDHYPIPVSRGGVHSLDNCVPSCRTCNRRAGIALRNTATATRSAS